MLRSSIGSKAVMAVTGLLLFGFVVGHMLGNLQIYLGQDVLNDYAEFLKSKPGLLWGARLGLLALLVAHVASAFKLTAENRAARPTPYVHEDTVDATVASRYMMGTGIVVLIFIIYHLLHFTVMATGLPEHDFVEHLSDGTTRHDVYGMVVAGFSITYISLFYIAAQIVLGMHLCHGVSSLFQTLGLNGGSCKPIIEKLGPVSAFIIVAGNISIPLSVMLGIIKASG